jgi:peptidoglycan L-alanyl-D-glutamate endopeptidase CwlK
MRILQNGSTGYDVALWQQFLTTQGFLNPGGIDGDFGKNSTAATKAFQTQSGLENDGIVGGDTSAAAAGRGFVVPRGPNDFSDEVFGADSRARLCMLHPAMADRIVELARQAKADHGIISIIPAPSAFRTFAKQHELFQQGRTKPGKIVTNADQGESYHNYGLATDLHSIIGGVPKTDDEEQALKRGPIGRKVGLEWGGDFTKFKDTPHFQLTKGLSIAECLNLNKQGGIIAVGNEVTRRLGIKDIFGRGDEVE